MADYYTQTVVDGYIKPDVVTNLELVILKAIFTSEDTPSGMYLYNESGIPPEINFDMDGLDHLFANPNIEESYLYDLIGLVEITHEGVLSQVYQIDVNDNLLIKIFQKILSRSTELDRVKIISAYTCSKMRVDGFGGRCIMIARDGFNIIDTNDDCSNVLWLMSDDELIAAHDEHQPVENKPSEADKLLRELYSATIGRTGFVDAVRLTSGVAYPWPAIDAIQGKIEDFLGIEKSEITTY